MSEQSKRVRNRIAPPRTDIVCQRNDLTARKQFHNGKAQKKGAEWIDHDLLKGIECILFKRSCRRLPRLQVTSLPLLDDAVPRRNGLQMVTDTFSDDELSTIEREYSRGVSSEEIVGFFTRK